MKTEKFKKIGKQAITKTRKNYWIIDILVIALNISFFMPGCEDIFQYSANEVDLKENQKNLNFKNIERINKIASQQAFKFVLFGDTQRFYDDLDDFVSALNKRNDISFALLAGDITDFGKQKEFQWVNGSLSTLKIPYVGVVGNHDLLGNGTKVYEQMFGPLNFTFSYNANKFVCINTNGIEYGFNGTVPDTAWLKNELTDDKPQNIFVVSHIPPFDGDFDKSLETGYAALLAENKKVKMSLHGHKHKYSLTQPYNDGVRYLVVGSMQKRNYAVISVNGEEVTVEEVYY